ncbi:DNA-3-methyladenine glycosylase [Pseudactinotalea sp. HY158]|uniref:DNA-3-methyladenine glycosylase family protein n=1 Tax=Pseudactinotalea sp. HY158 TaxID=2654547 RepID=UPI00129CA12E|nr:AlkA N-terminal domain-containing protein [Pseudactinotalea sp. HY158]QGH69969.1 hypothetical protein GCE65_10970 [Pseudactinotalea sp. HY158]
MPTVDLPAPSPYDAPGVFGFLAARAIEGVETAQLAPGGPLTYARTLRLPGGPAVIEVTATGRSHGDPSAWRLRARLDLADAGDEAAALGALRRLLDLDTDPAEVDAALAADPVLAPRVAAIPGIRVPGASDPHELLLRAVVGQQISVARAREHLGRLTRMLGSPVDGGAAGLTRLVPTARQLLEGLPEPERPLDPERPLRLPARSIAAVRAIAGLVDGSRDVLDPGIDPDVDPDVESQRWRARLTAIPGIGPWTAAYAAMRLRGDPDAWLLGDVAVLAGARVLGLTDPALSRSAAHAALGRRAQRWSPWRSYATMHLWRVPRDR